MDLVLVLQILSISAIITTISLFFCGIPICIEIWKRKTTQDISGMPFVMGLLGGCFWLRYGFLKADPTMITVNAVGVSLFSSYTLFYLAMSTPRRSFGLQVIAVLSTIFTMVLMVFIYEEKSIDFLGVACMTFNIVNFGAPLAGLSVVLRKRCCDTLPLPMCVANLLVSSQWCLYGVIVEDVYVMIPNGCGMVLAVLQLALFIIFPRKHGQKALIAHCLPFCNVTAVEEEDEEDEEKGSSNHRTHRVSDILRRLSHGGGDCRESLLANQLANQLIIDPSSSCSFTAKNMQKSQSGLSEKYSRSLSFDTASTHTTGSQMDMFVGSTNLAFRTLSAPQLTEDGIVPPMLEI